jgi:hypothetical protein
MLTFYKMFRAFKISHQNSVCTPLPYISCYLSRPSHQLLFAYPNMWRTVQTMPLFVPYSYPPSCHIIPISSKHSPRPIIAKHPQVWRSSLYFLAATRRRLWAGIAQSVWRLATGRTVRGPNPGREEILHTRPNRPWGLPNFLYNGYRVSLSGGKAASAWRWLPTPSSADVKEREQLYLYSPSGPTWPILWWTDIQWPTFRENLSVLSSRIKQLNKIPLAAWRWGRQFIPKRW